MLIGIVFYACLFKLHSTIVRVLPNKGPIGVVGLPGCLFKVRWFLMRCFLNLFQDVTGCNSNDSGPNPSLRPSPSPTGSASSRSMSPAVGE